MKRFIFVFALVLGFALTATAQQENTETKSEETLEKVAKETQQEDGPILKFEVEEVDFGTIEQDSEPFRTVKFTNVGNEPLFITNARGSCGCTVPQVPKGAIKPGETAEMKVRYDTKRIGMINKTVTLTTNEAVGRRVIKVVGNVTKKAEGLPVKETNPLNQQNQ